MKDITRCEVCGKETKGENANYCMYCGSSLKGITKKQKLVVLKEVEVSPEELKKIIKE